MTDESFPLSKPSVGTGIARGKLEKGESYRLLGACEYRIRKCF